MSAHRYRKKPLVVEAEQIVVSLLPMPDGSWYSNNPFGAVVMRRERWWKAPVPMIETLEGWLRVRPGDYVVKGIRGEYYPVNYGIFMDTYDVV